MKGLVLEGGGARGAYHAGAILALNKNKIKFDAVVGTSIGSINGAFYCLNNHKMLKTLWIKTSSEELFGIPNDVMKAIKDMKFSKQTLSSGIKVLDKITKNVGIDTSNIRKILNKNIDEDKFRNSNIEFGLATFNLSDMQPKQLFIKDIPKGKLVEYLLASSYLPVFKLEKIIDDKFYLDGGVFDRCPVDMLLNKGYDEIYVVKSYPNKIRGLKTNGEKLTYIIPKRSLGNILMFEKESVIKNVNLGYYDTLKVIKNLDGKDYYIKYRDIEFYKSIIENKKLLRKYIYKDEKELIIRIIENVLEEFDINKFKVYNIKRLIRLCKKLIKNDVRHKHYKIIINMKVRWFQ